MLPQDLIPEDGLSSLPRRQARIPIPCSTSTLLPRPEPIRYGEDTKAYLKIHDIMQTAPAVIDVSQKVKVSSILPTPLLAFQGWTRKSSARECFAGSSTCWRHGAGHTREHFSNFGDRKLNHASRQSRPDPRAPAHYVPVLWSGASFNLIQRHDAVCETGWSPSRSHRGQRDRPSSTSSDMASGRQDFASRLRCWAITHSQ
jgi:hypothetical protein